MRSIAIIFYCISGKRFDKKINSELINKIKETYGEKNQIPVIIIRTQSSNEKETEDFLNSMK